MATDGPEHVHEHEHEPGHAHGHPHAHPGAGARGHVSAHNPHAGQGPVTLELGDGLGAVVLRVPPDMVGEEIEVSPVGCDGRRHHVEVLPRRTPGGSIVFAAVYPGLREGGWTLWRADGTPALVVEVADGVVSEVSWPGG